MRKLLLIIVSLLFAGNAYSQQFFANSRIVKMSNYHATVGTSTAAAIPSASIGGNVLSWKICNDAVNTSTYLLVGQAVDVSDDGTMLAPGACYVCDNCTPALLGGMKVEAQAASNGYSVIQYRN